VFTTIPPPNHAAVLTMVWCLLTGVSSMHMVMDSLEVSRLTFE